MALTLKYIGETTVPVEVELLIPDNVQGKTLEDIQQIQIFHGNKAAIASDFFKISGDPEDGQMHFSGDMSGVHWVGAKMSTGAIHIEGDVGRHLGAEMTGGIIYADGDASDWVGAEIVDGVIYVKGSAGHLIGSAYRGSACGMSGGIIMICGSAGNEIGHTMRRGLIAIGGRSGDAVGFNMIAGTIFLCGECGIRHGAGMRRGNITIFNHSDIDVLPSFQKGAEFNTPFLRIYLRQLKNYGFPVHSEWLSGSYQKYAGDMIEIGKGELLIRK